MKKLSALFIVVVIILTLTGCNGLKTNQKEESYTLRYIDVNEYGQHYIFLLGFKNDYDDNMDHTKDGIYPKEWDIKELVLEGSQTDIIIPDTIDSCDSIALDGGTFNGCKSIKTVTFPDSVIGIEEGAFDDCSSELVIIGSENSNAIEFAKHFNIKYKITDNR